MICLPLPISEYLIYKFPEESHLSAEAVQRKRHEEYMKRYPTLEFLYKVLDQKIVLNNNNNNNRRNK